MKKAMVVITCLALAIISSGCTAPRARNSDPLIGESLAFTTAEPAPADFDSWTFFWSYPALEEFDADLEYYVLCEDEVYYAHDCGMVTPGGSVRSDFWRSMFKETETPEKDLITPFRGKHITVLFRATKGRLRFPDHGIGSFGFYKRGADGKVDKRNPIKQIEAVLK